jgi:hypothetical protein
MMPASSDMEGRQRMLSNHALVVKEVGALSVCSCEELKDVVFHHFGIRKHEFYVYRSRPDPFVIIFSECRARDIVFAAGRAIDGPVELSFSAWNVDDFNERVNIPYHVKVSIEGLPHHAWSQDVAAKVLGDEAFIHHIEESTRKKVDLHTFHCWTFSSDPSRIPQVVFLTMVKNEVQVYSDLPVHFTRPREVKKGNVFKVLVHIDVVEDLLFYHYPREELIANGKILWRDFVCMAAQMESLRRMNSFLRPGTVMLSGSLVGVRVKMMMKTGVGESQELMGSWERSTAGWTAEA